MKLVVFSDSHGELENIRDVIATIGTKLTCVIHLGDYDQDAIQLQKEFPTLRFFGVRGNNDGGGAVPSQRMVRYRGKSLLLTHGHKQRVYWGYQTICYWAEEQGADAVLFGHTHHPVNEEVGKMLLFNPGSISYPRGGQWPTFGILEITECGVIQGTIMEYHGKNQFYPKKR